MRGGNEAYNISLIKIGGNEAYNISSDKDWGKGEAGGPETLKKHIERAPGKRGLRARAGPRAQRDGVSSTRPRVCYTPRATPLRGYPHCEFAQDVPDLVAVPPQGVVADEQRKHVCAEARVVRLGALLVRAPPEAREAVGTFRAASVRFWLRRYGLGCDGGRGLGAGAGADSAASLL